MGKRVLSIILMILMCWELIPLSAAGAVTLVTHVTGEYTEGVITVNGTGFSSGVSYTVRIVDEINSSIKAMGQTTADGSGNISASITTGLLGNPMNYAVYVNKPDGTLAGSDSSITGDGLNVTAVYADGVVTVRGTGFLNGVGYTVRVVDRINSSVKAMGQTTADGSGNISASVTTGELGTLANYTVYINNPDGTLAGSDISITAEGMTNAQKVAADKAALVDLFIKGSNTGLSHVTTNLTLITGIPGGAGCTITWASSNTAIVAINGTVTRPVSGDVAVTLTATITSGSASDTKQFTVTVKQAVVLYTATIQAGSGGTITASASGSYASGAVITLAATANSGYTFNNWTSSGGGTFANANSLSTTFTMPAGNVTITAHFSYSGGGSPPAPSSTPTPPSTLVQDDTTILSLTARTVANTANGKDMAEINAETMAVLIERAKLAEAAGQKVVVEIDVETTENARAGEVKIPQAAFKQLANTTDADVKVNTGIGTITFDKKAIDAVSSAASTGDISIGIEKVAINALSEELQARVGDRPVYEFSIKSGNTAISDFNGGKAEISVPYTLKPGENPNAIVVYYIDSDKNLQTVQGRYDPETGTVKFTVNHFSQYVIGYHQVNFSDVSETAWYYKAVSFIAARDLSDVSGGSKFTPAGNITRADFVVMVMNAYGIALDTDNTQNFSDAGNKYYTSYLGTAKRLGLIFGSGDKFFPEAAISRQDMFVIFYRILSKLDELPTLTTDKKFESFKDTGSVANYAKEAMKLFVETGAVSGDGNRLNPEATATRAQAAQVIYTLFSK